MDINALKFDGLGGRRSSGYGKFDFEVLDLRNVQNEDLKTLNLLLSSEKEMFMTLSPFLPKGLNDEMLENAFYQVVRRSGFVDSATYNPHLVKKKDVYALSVGSTFKNKLQGQILDVSTSAGSHKVYKFLKPIFVGV